MSEPVEDGLPPVVRRFLEYVRVDTAADPASDTVPSSARQKDLGAILAGQLAELGVADAALDDRGYVYGHLEARGAAPGTPTVALVAHQDTSPDEPGGPVRPVVHRRYAGGVVELPGDPSVRLDPARSPALSAHVGHDLITSDGTTLLGSDDKAGIAIIMQAVEDLQADPDAPRPPLAICFTVDEEIGRGVDHLDYDRLGADVAYTVDGGAVGTFSFETFHAAEATLTVEGVNVHPGYAKDAMVNAATIAVEIVQALPFGRPETTADREGYFFVHRIEGGTSRAEVRMLLRDFEEDGMQRRKAVLEALVEVARLRHPKARIALSIRDQYRNMRSYIEATDPRVVSFAFAAARELGIELVAELVRGGTDGSRMSEEGLPTPNIFTGGHDYHSRFEWNTVQNLEASLAYAKALVRYWAEHGADRPGVAR